MSKNDLTASEVRKVDELVSHYIANHDKFSQFTGQLSSLFLGEKALTKHVHSIKSRVKDPEHLRRKLIEKFTLAKKSRRSISISKDNLFQRINDLVGFRILHMHTRQMKDIDESIKRLFSEQRYEIIKGPVAKTWDDDSREYFSSLGIKTEKSPSMYTSVHYEVKESSKRKFTFELQVRTLMEEVWGEVSHMLNYPSPSSSDLCREQIKVLARATSTCSSLVNSIFKAHAKDS